MVQIKSTHYNGQTNSLLKSYKLLDIYTTNEQLNKTMRTDETKQLNIQSNYSKETFLNWGGVIICIQSHYKQMIKQCGNVDNITIQHYISYKSYLLRHCNESNVNTTNAQGIQLIFKRCYPYTALLNILQTMILQIMNICMEKYTIHRNVEWKSVSCNNPKWYSNAEHNSM